MFRVGSLFCLRRSRGNSFIVFRILFNKFYTDFYIKQLICLGSLLKIIDLSVKYISRVNWHSYQILI